ncbi:MAG: Uma2 family endonuclease [Candidatus Eremiobacteraeota bacterium]|nr:Uma2 family endonuclease [Candidatus Eremiobacteraeota bacterium]MBC5802013.1 Uma2 family endonuclease [Candidatus Eremiobacteraeota bacterium]
MATEYKRRDITVDEYHRMAEIGIFDPDERVELIDGELIEMAPIGNRHWSRHATIVHYLHDMLGRRAFIVPQGSFPLDRRSEPQPDVAILAPRNYEERRPDPGEMFALIEVAESSIEFDLGRKQRLYASRGIPEYLVVDIGENRLVRFTQPSDVAYGQSRKMGYRDRFSLVAIAEVTLNADPFLAPR